MSVVKKRKCFGTGHLYVLQQVIMLKFDEVYRSTLSLLCGLLQHIDACNLKKILWLYSDGSIARPPFFLEPAGTLAREEQDFRLESTIVSLQAGENETEVILFILDDSEPEGQEVFFIYLSEPEGGAQITDSPYQGFGAFAKITILGKIIIAYVLL